VRLQPHAAVRGVRKQAMANFAGTRSDPDAARTGHASVRLSGVVRGGSPPAWAPAQNRNVCRLIVGVQQGVEIPVVGWDDQAEAMGRADKGHWIEVEGTLAVDKWTTRDGKEQTQLVVQAEKVVRP
jgi:hypothetical protein